MNDEKKLRAEHIKKYGLRIKLFILNCGQLDHNSVGHKIASYFNKNLDYCDEDPASIFEAISESKFLQYSTVIFIFNGYCRCRLHILQAILHCASENNYLRYKSKLVILNYVATCCYRSHTNSIAFHEEDDLGLNYTSIYDNLIVFRINVQHEMDSSQTFVVMLTIADATPIESIQKILEHSNRPPKHEVVRASTNAELYLYTINPALAIIVNSYYFTEPDRIRAGSELDVIRLMRELKIARIPYILIEDCDRQELLQILSYIEHKDFRPLKSLLFFLMSHGDSDNVVYTHDGSINIKSDVVKRIQTNKSLEEVETMIVVNACRGPINLVYSLEEEYEDIQPTTADNLKNNTILFYSVPDRIQSPRSPDEGCPFIQRFCDHFRQLNHTKDVRQMEAQIDNDLKEMDYFDGLDKCSEMVLNTQNDAVHNIIHIPANVAGMMELIDSIIADFPMPKTQMVDDDGRPVTAEEFCAWGGVAAKQAPSHDEHNMRTLFHICGSLNEMKFPKKEMVEKYFAADLDED